METTYILHQRESDHKVFLVPALAVDTTRATQYRAGLKVFVDSEMSKLVLSSYQALDAAKIERWDDSVVIAGRVGASVLLNADQASAIQSENERMLAVRAEENAKFASLPIAKPRCYSCGHEKTYRGDCRRCGA